MSPLTQYFEAGSERIRMGADTSASFSMPSTCPAPTWSGTTVLLVALVSAAVGLTIGVTALAHGQHELGRSSF